MTLALTTQTLPNPPDEYYIAAAEYLIRHNSTWCVDFCNGCPFLHVNPASFCDPGDTDCDADLNPLNECCWRHEEVFEDKDVHREACERYAWDKEDEDYDTFGGEAV